jgi:AcrR family transcriptional regulator
MIPKTLAAELRAHAHGRVPRELRRRQLLAEAYELFVARGFPGASMDELARRMGVSKPVIYDLAGSKEQLFRDVMAGIQAELAAAVATAVAGKKDLPARLHAGILAFLRFVQARRRGWAALLSMESAGGEVAALRRGPAALVAQLIGEDVRLGAREVDAVAHAVNGAAESVALWWQGQPEETPERLAELLAALLTPGLLAMARRR